MRQLLPAIILAACFFLVRPAHADPPPVPAAQPHPDIFQVAGIPNLQTYNPVTVQAKLTHLARYRLVIMPGCTAGLIEQDLGKLAFTVSDVQFSLVRDDGNPHFTVRVNCGIEHETICGSVNIFCLGRGFPGNADVEISDIMYTPVLWPEITRLSILLHEIIGHAVGTWMEQYCIGSGYPVGHVCYGLPRFTSAPGWVDFMNTGPNSRVLFTSSTLGRWERTMYALVFCGVGEPNEFGHRWDSCSESWLFPDGGRFRPNSGCGEFYLPDGRMEWGNCATWGGGARWNDILKCWLARDGGIWCDGRYINIRAAITIP